MRKVIMYCDRCKKEFEKWNHKREENIGVGEIVHEDGNPYLDCQKDLCESCYTELENWWNYKSQESEKINCKATKCENCINHNDCDYEPQESEEDICINH